MILSHDSAARIAEIVSTVKETGNATQYGAVS